MNSIINLKTVGIAVLAIVFSIIFTFSILPQVSNYFSADVAEACCGDGGGSSGGDSSSSGYTPKPKVPRCDFLKASKSSLPAGGGEVTLSWETTNASYAKLSGHGTVSADGSKTVHISETTTFVLTVSSDGYNDSCTVKIPVEKQKVASCDSFTADQTYLPHTGGDVTLTWATTNATYVTINGKSVSEYGSESVFVDTNTTFTLLAKGEGSNNTATCKVEVKLKPHTPDAECLYLKASPEWLSHGGGNVTLTWDTKNADSVYLSGVDDGYVGKQGSKTVFVNKDTTFTLTAKGTKSGSDTCTKQVTVKEKQKELSCDYFKSSDYRVKSGDYVTLTWETTGANYAEINPDLGSVPVDGSRDVRITRNVTYTLTIKDGHNSKTCSVSIEKEEKDDDDDNGGGTPTPRCELKISDKKIKKGEEVTLKWNTSNANNVVIKDNHGNVLLDTDDMSSKEKKDWLDGEMKLKPTKDTEYTLNAERGSRDKKCKVEVDVEEVKATPYVSGVYLTQVPYTGFEAGPMLTLTFYGLLTLWALYVAYVLVIRRDSILGFSLAGAHDHVSYTDVSTAEVAPLHISEAEEYVQSTMTATIPHNLPVAPEYQPVIGYAAAAAQTEAVDVMTAIENRAHEQNVLLSSDAMRLFANVVAADEHISTLDAVIAEAKAMFPSEDGWVVINLNRMETLLAEADVAAAEEVSATPITKATGSLAEAIVTGNIVAAYQLIENRPMVALADAAGDLDAVYRARKGEKTIVSDYLAAESAKLSTEQLEAVIAALTGALDGTYTDEASAVKMAIMKAVKAVS